MPTTAMPPPRLPKKRITTTAPPIKYFQDIDTDRLNQSMSALFYTWIPETLDIFGLTGTALFSRHFWISQIQYELDNRLWQPDFLGRKATDEERDWLVEAATKVHWPRIQKALARQWDATASRGSEKGKRKTKLRRAVTLLERTDRVDIGEDEESNGGDEESRDAEPNLTVWVIFDNTSLERELKKVERDEELGWMRAGKDGFELQAVLGEECDRGLVKSNTAQRKALLDETLRSV
jgi:hypothetical protein